MIVLVCGGRDFSDSRAVFRALRAVNEKHGIDMVIHGGATGADERAAAWALANGVPVAEVKANWGLFGAKAGPIRNRAMLKLQPGAVVAFPGGKGTANMVKQAKAAGIPVWEVPSEA